MKKLLLLFIAMTVPALITGAQEDSLFIDEVVVTGSRVATDSKSIPNTVTGISREKLAGNFSFSLLPAVMDQTPGLFATSRGTIGYGVNTGAGSIRIRGVGGMSQLLVLIDGQPQFAGLMSHPVPDVYQTMLAEKVEVIRGPSSLYYGSSAMGGVVNIVTRKVQEDGFKTDIDLQAGSYGTYQAQASARMKKGRFTSVAGVQYQHTDGHRENSGFGQAAGFVKLGYALSQYWKADADVNLTQTDASNPGPEYAPLYDNDMKITRGLASVQITDDYGWTNGALRLFYDWGHHEIDDGTTDMSLLPTDRLYIHDDYITGFNLFQSARLFGGNRTTVGLEYQNYGGSAWNRDKRTGNRTFLMKDDNGNIVRRQSVDDVAAYVDFRQSFGGWLTLDAGIRTDWHSVTGTEWVPQAGAVFHVSATDNIKLLVSKGFRNPTVRDMYMFPPSNTGLLPERVLNYELAYSGNVSHVFDYGLNLFLMKGSNIINTVRTDGKPRNVNTGSFRHWGIEADAAWRIGSHWNVNGNYSLLEMKIPVEGAPEHKLYLGATCRYGRFTACPSLLYVGNLFLTGGTGAETESFTLLNMTASYQVTDQIQVFARGDNLLGRRYRTYSGFRMPGITGTAGVRLSF